MSSVKECKYTEGKEPGENVNQLCWTLPTTHIRQKMEMCSMVCSLKDMKELTMVPEDMVELGGNVQASTQCYKYFSDT